MANYIVTVSYGRVRGSARNYPYYQPAKYARHTTTDGRVVWKYVEHCGIARRSLKLAQQDALELAERLNCDFLDNVRQWNPVENFPKKQRNC